MKYIVVQVPIGDDAAYEYPVIFPESLVHAEVAELIAGLPQFEGKAKVVSAGTCSTLGVGDSAYGESFTLKMKHRPKRDAQLINMCDYGGGYVDLPKKRARKSK